MLSTKNNNIIQKRKEIQLSNLLNKKYEIEKLLEEINNNLINIEDKIVKSTEERINKWREQFKINKFKGISPPNKPINFIEEINQKKQNIIILQNKIYEIDGLLSQLQIKLKNNEKHIQEQRTEEINIYNQEKQRINEKYNEINNNFIIKLNEIINEQIIIENYNENINKDLENINLLIEKNKKNQIINRYEIRDNIHNINKLKKNIQNQNNTINQEINKLYEDLNIEKENNNLTRIRYNYLKKIFDNDPNNYNDIKNNIDDLSYELINQNRKIIKLKKNIENMENNKKNISLNNFFCNNNKINIKCYSHKELKEQQKKNKNITEKIQLKLKDIDNLYKNEENKYIELIQILMDELKNCEERKNIMESRLNNNLQDIYIEYQNNKNELYNNNINFKNKKNNIEKEIEILNQKFKEEREYDFTKLELLNKKNKLNINLEQINRDILLINKI